MFNDTKYTRWYWSIITVARSRLTKMTCRGKPHSEETKQKIREAALKRYAHV